MDKKSKVLIIVFIILILVSTAFTYYKYIVLKDFPVTESTE